MAKDSASTRIPRLDGGSRIPLPGSLRPPSSNAHHVTSLAARTSQILQRASTVGLPQKRPSTLAGLRPSIASANALKRSASGDHITNAVNLVTKKTTTALKKWMGKSEKMPLPAIAHKTHVLAQSKNTRKQAPQIKPPVPVVPTDTDYFATPRPLTRSDTFVRTDSPNDITQFSPNLLTQSTPAPPTNGSLTTTRIIRPPDINETTKLLSNNNRHALYNTQSLDSSHLNPVAQFGETFEANIKHPMQFDETKEDATINLNNQYSPNATQAMLKPNLTATFNVPALLGQTLNVVSSSETFTSKPQVPSSDTILFDTIPSLGTTKIIDSADAISPVTNATYSNPDSLDNLQLLEDVSAPSGFLEMDLTLQSDGASELEKTRDNLLDCTVSSETDELNSTLKALATEKAHMKLPLNSTVNTERLLDLTNILSTSEQQIHKMNLTEDYLDSSYLGSRNTTQLLYMTQHQYTGTEHNTPEYNPAMKFQDRTHLLSSPQISLKGAQSDLVLPTCTPEDEPLSVPMKVDANALLAMGAGVKDFYSARDGNQPQVIGSASSLQDVSNPNAKQRSRYSFGLDLTESTLDCSIDLVDVSLSSNATGQPTANSSIAAYSQSPSLQAQQQQQQQQQHPLRRQTSFELDESLGILTPDQMKEFLDSTNTNNTNNLELPLSHNGNNMAMHHMRIDQTPSPEELPLDPVEIKTDVTEILLSQQHNQSNICESDLRLQHQQQLQQRQQHLQQQLQCSSISTAETISTHTDIDISSKTSDAMTKSNVSKISTSFITSVTSVTSLDTGYQGDGEMSRPASRGACDHSPSNGPAARKGGHVSRQPSFNQQLQQQQIPLVRRQDPMTDSDFFTESDADDIFHRGDRRAQVIDGQLYGPMLQPAASVFISEDPEDSCMESSGIFTDVENRCDDDLAQMRRQDTQDAILDMSPEGDGDSTETVKSNREATKNAINSERNANKSEIIAGGDVTVITTMRNIAATTLGQGQLSSSQTSSTIHSSISTDRLSAATLSNRTSYCSVDGNTINADCKSFSSLEEAFDESTSALNITDTLNNTILSPASAERARRSRLSTAGNDSGGVNCGFGAECSASVESQQHESVLKVTPPRKHASLTSLSTVVANSGTFYGAKVQNVGNKFTYALSATRGPILIERETHSESGTAGTKAACASTSSSTTSLSVDNQSNNNKNIQRSALEAAVAAAAKATNAKSGTNKRTPRTTKFASARNSPKQRTSTGSVPSVSDIGATSLNVRKKQTPNKWEAVMNKIESNKALPKKNLKEVKSKVSIILRPSNGVGATGDSGCNATTNASTTGRFSGSGVQGRSSVTLTPLIRRSPSSTAASGSRTPHTNGMLLPLRPTDNGTQRSNTGSPITTQQVSKRIFQGVAAKRGRSYSKDSQKSSQSDLSMASAGGGSPKLLAITPLRAAKKRDVRNLSISPTDLGPPPKAQQTAKSTPARLKPTTISLTQKRYPSQSVSATPSTTSTAVSTPTGSGGGNLKVKSPPTVKKFVKDQNRGIGTATSKNVKHTDAPRELHEINHNNNNSITTTLSHGTTTRTNSQTPSPILGHHGKKTATAAASAVSGVTLSGTVLEKKTQSKFLPTRGKSLLQKSHQQQRSAEDTPVSAAEASERLDATELQRLKYLNRHSCNGRLDYEAIERHLEQTELQEERRNKSIEVLGVLLQYAVHDLDAFASPRMKAEKEKMQNYLCSTLKLLDEAKSNCSHLQDQLCDKEGYYSQREEDLQALHRCEIEKAQTNLSDYQAFAQEKFAAFESQLETQAAEHKRTLDSYRLEIDNKLSQRQQQLDEAEQRELKLKECFNLLTISEKELREKLTSTENAYAARLQAAAERENDLNERVKLLAKELNGLRTSNENRERELRDKLNLSQDEISVLRSSQRSFNESLDRSSGVSSPRNSSMSELARLQSEADSLHCVLELKQKEISKLTKHNEELMRDAEERGVLQGKISLLESSNEMLKSELDIKSEKEKDFLRQINDMQKAYNHEMVKRKRLSYDNEQLQWQLKQRSEQLHIVETKLHELSAVESINASNQSSIGSLSRSQLMNGSSLINMQMEDISPPTSPVVKGVIEKPDSVSWVLEMDDETPEAAASKMVKRAGSFRSVERSPSTRRQLSGCSSAINTSLNSVGSGPTYGNGNSTVGPNPLSQSMSATSVIRQHSSDGRHEFSNRSHSRIRSKSVSVKSTEPTQAGPGALNTGSVGTKSGKRLMRQSSSSSARKQHQLELINWKEPISSSSPHANALRPRTSTLCSEVSEETVTTEDSLFQRTPIISTTTRKLITCDTSKLNSGERLDIQSLPTHSSVHDLKKKFHEIQESAGEAMVSGTNSEDEGCSASSDEIVCSVSTSSATTGSTSSLKHSHMSLEEVLLLDKIHSLNGTPMEVSWSDDPEVVFTNGSTV